MSDLLPANDHDMLREYLAARDVPCPLCNYNLHALQGTACPECGHKLVLKLDLADPVRGAYLAGLIGLSLAAGFNGLLLVVIILGMIILGGGPPLGLSLFLVIMTFISSGLLLTWIRRSISIRRTDRRMRTILALACWLLPGLSIVAIFMMMLME